MLGESLSGNGHILRDHPCRKGLIWTQDRSTNPWIPTRRGLNRDLGFSAEDRKENIRHIGEIAKLLGNQAFLVIVAFISPFRQDRDLIRQSVEDRRFIEVFIDCPLQVCEERDTKGLYKKARNGEISNFTGISSPYEPPPSPDIHVKTAEHSVEECVGQMVEFLEHAKVFKV